MALKKGLTIDVGHQGKGIDPGAVNTTQGLVEADIVLAISLYQAERFKALGVPVALTRTSDKKMTNTERTNLIKWLGYEDCISNHINAGGGDGAEVIHSVYDVSKFGELVRICLAEVGQNYRKTYTRTLPGNPKLDYYFMHRDTGSVAVNIVEYAFIDSKGDDILLLKNNWKDLAEAVVKAYCLHRNYKYVAPNGKSQVNPTPVTVDESVKWAIDNGIFNGKDINEPATRKQVVTMLHRMYKLLKG